MLQQSKRQGDLAFGGDRQIGHGNALADAEVVMFFIAKFESSFSPAP
jgi:hypothetical protein